MSARHISILGLALSVELTWIVGTLSQHDGQCWQAFASLLTHCLLISVCCALPLSRSGPCPCRVSEDPDRELSSCHLQELAKQAAGNI